MATDLLSALNGIFSQYGFQHTYWVAFSGGLDSHALLHLCYTLRQQLPLKLRAIHINHGLSAHAQEWQKQCARQCAVYDIELVERSVHIAVTNGESLEEAARNARYQIFAEYVQENHILLTAHHQDDQAETLLLQLLRGAGPKGLAAMAPVKSFSRGLHARPLLDFSREQLQAYANAHQLQWVEDESNQNISFTRNFIRHEVLPLLTTRWPSVTETLARSAAHCGEAQTLLEEFALDDWLRSQGSQKNTLSVERLLSLSAARQRLVLRAWIQSLGFPLPDTKKMTVIQQDVLTAAWDKMPCVCWGDVELRRYRDDLFLMLRLREVNIEEKYVWKTNEPLELPGVGELRAQQKGENFLREIVVRFRCEGESVNLPNRGRHSLKKLFQEWGVPPWLRDRVPLLFAGDVLVGAVGYYCDERFSLTLTLSRNH